MASRFWFSSLSKYLAGFGRSNLIWRPAAGNEVNSWCIIGAGVFYCFQQWDRICTVRFWFSESFLILRLCLIFQGLAGLCPSVLQELMWSSVDALTVWDVHFQKQDGIMQLHVQRTWTNSEYSPRCLIFQGLPGLIWSGVLQQLMRSILDASSVPVYFIVFNNEIAYACSGSSSANHFWFFVFVWFSRVWQVFALASCRS